MRYLGGEDAQLLLAEARGALKAARSELSEAIRMGDHIKLRKACETAWLATIKAVDAILEAHGLGRAESHRDRRDRLRALERTRPEVAELGLRDRYMARMSYLHIDGFYEGTLSSEEAVEQMEKVRELVEDVESLITRLA